MGGVSIPGRRCVGCGRVAPKSELVRLVAAPAEPGHRPSARAVLDRAGTMPGRGAYLCSVSATRAPKPECLRLAVRRGGVQHALRRAVELPAELLDAVSLDAGPLESDSRVAQPDGVRRAGPLDI